MTRVMKQNPLGVTCLVLNGRLYRHCLCWLSCCSASLCFSPHSPSPEPPTPPPPGRPGPNTSGPTLESRAGFENSQERFNYAFILICKYLRGLWLSLIKKCWLREEMQITRLTHRLWRWIRIWRPVTGDWAAGRSGWSLRLSECFLWVCRERVAPFVGN